LTASPEQLVLMLYDGAIRFLNQGAAALRNGQSDLGRQRVRRADAIIEELNTSLDLSHGDVPERLQSIYVFCRRQLLDANIHGAAEQVDVVVKLLAELREGWQGALTAQAAAAA
jgi:flagellar protein FliS